MRLTTLGLLALLAACATQQKQTEALMDSSLRYQEGLRWQRHEDAALHVPPAKREQFLDDRDEVSEDLRIDDYEVIRVKLRKERSEALVQVKYMWHLDSIGVVHETVTEQHWVQKGKHWFVIAETRKRGEPMPGVAEPKPGAAEDDEADEADDEEVSEIR